jgi:Lon-like protease
VRAYRLRRLFQPGFFLGLGVVLFGIALVLWLLPSNQTLLLPDKAHPAAPLVTVAGATARNDPGGIYYVDVEERPAKLLEKLFGGLHDGADLVPTAEIQGPGITAEAQRSVDLQEMKESQQTAAAVALRAYGKRVIAIPTGALIEDVFPGTPASRGLRTTDIITAIDGKRIVSSEGASRILTKKRPGDVVRVTVDRGGRKLTYPLKMVAGRKGGPRAVIGVYLGQAQRIVLPVKVSIDAHGVGGPSAGLAFALEVLQKLGRNVDHGHKVAATGTIALNGAVGPIGGIKQKTIGAREAGVDVFLVPAGDNARDARKYAHGLRIIPVKTFQQALRALATLPQVA